MSDIATRLSDDIVVPGTGEIVSLAEASGVARALRAIREHKQQVEDVRALLERALVEESERAGTKTLHLGDGLTASIGPDTEIEWDLDELEKLKDAGLPDERYAELVTEVVSYKVNASVAKQIEGANARYGEIVVRARNRVPKRQTVRIEEK